MRWLIQDQIKGEPGLNHDPGRGAVKAPLLLWGPYLWADGVKPRKGDGLVWEREDLAGDGAHPSDERAAEGRRPAAEVLQDRPDGQGLVREAPGDGGSTHESHHRPLTAARQHARWGAPGKCGMAPRIE